MQLLHATKKSMLLVFSIICLRLTCWDLHSLNGPNTIHNSNVLLLDRWTMGDNWSRYRGGKGDNGKTGVTKKGKTSKKLVDEIIKAGIMVARNTRAVGAKIDCMEIEYKND